MAMNCVRCAACAPAGRSFIASIKVSSRARVFLARNIWRPRMRPFLSVDTISFEVFRLKFVAWCSGKAIVKEEDMLKVLPGFVDDSLLQPLLAKFSASTTTLNTALAALKAEYLRKSRPPNAEEEFQRMTSTPETAVDNCERLIKLASFLDLSDSAVKHRLFNSLPISLQQCAVPWLDANPKSSSRELANFIAKCPTQPHSSQVPATMCSAASISQQCEHCKRKGHTKERCFKLRTCWRCNAKGHIAKYCSKN